MESMELTFKLMIHQQISTCMCVRVCENGYVKSVRTSKQVTIWQWKACIYVLTRRFPYQISTYNQIVAMIGKLPMETMYFTL